MKSFYSICVLLLVSVVSYSQFSVGGGLTIGSHSGFNTKTGVERFNVGLHLKGDYDLSEKLGVNASFHYFYPQTTTGSVTINQGEPVVFETTTNSFGGTVDLEYKIFDNKYNSAYLLIGPSLSMIKVLETELGIGGDIGVGVTLSNNIYYDIRLQYRQWSEDVALSNYQGLLTIGYLFPLSNNSKDMSDSDEN